MKPTIKRLLCAVLVSGMLTGCHGTRSKEGFVIPSSLSDSKTYNLTFWAKNDTNKNQTAVYEKAIQDFETLYPNIDVNIKLYTDYSRIYNDVITNIATNTTPNVCITYPDHIASYLESEDTVVALDDLFVDPQYGLGGSEVRFDSPTVEEIVPAYLKEGRFEGASYAIPFMRSSEVCYINADYVEALGYEIPEVLTWDFIWEVSEKATAKNADGTYVLNGQPVFIPFIYKSTDNMMIQYLKQQDAGYSTDAGTIDLFNSTTKDFLNTIISHVETGAFSTFAISGYPANFLNAGQCIFAIDSTAGSTWMGSDAPLSDVPEERKVYFDTVVRPVPQTNPEELTMISQGPSICLFNHGDSEEVLASWLFAQYLLSNDVQIGYATTEGYVPVTTKAQSDPIYQTYLSQRGEDDAHYSVKMDATNLVLENPENTFVTPVFNGSASLRQAAGALIETVTKSTRRKETIDLDEVFHEVSSLYRLDQIQTSGISQAGKQDLGPLPSTAIALIGGLVLAWVCIGVVVLRRKVREKREGVQ